MLPTVPEIAEADARGRVAAIYADIRDLTGAPLVNLLYRHLATDVDVLAWVWSQVRPRLMSGALPARAAALQDELRMLVHNWTRAVRLPAQVPLDEVLNVLDNYNRANAINLVALAGLPGLHLDQAGVVTPRPLSVKKPDTRPLRPLPALPPLASLDAATSQKIDRLNRMGERGQPAVVASLYRHLSLWPPVLDLMETLLLPLQGLGKLDEARRQTWNLARACCEGQAAAGSLPPPPSFHEGYSAFLGSLAQVTIAKMIPIGLLTRQALAGKE